MPDTTDAHVTLAQTALRNSASVNAIAPKRVLTRLGLSMLTFENIF